MKRSKLFLATTTCLLAIAGVAAAKAHRFTTPAFYYTAAGVTHCKSFNTNCVVGTTHTCVTAIRISGVTKNFTIYTASGCVNKLKYN